MKDRTKMTGEWLAFCSACPVPEIANVFNRARVPFHQVTGLLNDEQLWNEVGDWVHASRVAFAMEHNRLGVMGLNAAMRCFWGTCRDAGSGRTGDAARQSHR